MCCRVRLSSDVSKIKLAFSIPPHRPTPNIVSGWNVAPTFPLPVIGYDAKEGERGEAFKRRRCPLLVDNFYVRKKVAMGKQAYALALAG